MPHTILDILTGRFSNGTTINDPATENDLIASIETHLTRLLNSRGESLVHLQGYGLPDISAIFVDLPYSTNNLVKAVRDNIKRFEPRLQKIKVQELNNAPNNRLHLEITGETVHGSLIKGITSFADGVEVQVSLQRLGSTYA